MAGRRNREFILLTEGYLASPDQLTDIYGLTPPVDHLPPHSSGPDAAAAWIIAASARAVAQRRGFDAGSLKMATFVIGRPKHSLGALSEWFTTEHEDSRYRVLIHARSYLHRERMLHEEFWDDRMYTTPKLRVKTAAFRRQIEQSERFLLALDRAYTQGPDATADLLSNCGHVYSYSTGKSPETQ